MKVEVISGAGHNGTYKIKVELDSGFNVETDSDQVNVLLLCEIINKLDAILRTGGMK
jgi:hypothetical protein